jgi:restriction system protein
MNGYIPKLRIRPQTFETAILDRQNGVLSQLEPTPLSIPDYQTLMLPVLESLADGEEHRLREITARIAERFNLTEDERRQLLPSGQQTIISNRVGWARAYLKKAGLVGNPARGALRITEEGHAVLKQKPATIDNKFLLKYPSYVEFVKTKRTASPKAPEESTQEQTPDDAIEAAYQTFRAALSDNLLDRVRTCSPQFFERLVVELLVAMGYGGSLIDAGKAVGRTGDGGIDGIIKEDRLGLDVVCIQAKRWQNTVGRPTVQEFAGSMAGFRAKKGVLITTSRFTKDAHEYVERIEQRIVLIDGDQLADFMIDHNIGVTRGRQYEIKRVDSDYFDEEAD